MVECRERANPQWNSDGDAPLQTPARPPSPATIASSIFTTPSRLHPTYLPSYEGVIMSSAVALPQHRLLESPNSRTIEIGPWTITASTNPISNAGQCDMLQAAIGGIPLPEMTFGSNSLQLEHKESGWKYSFKTEEALKGVKNGELEDGDGGVKVGYADAWLKSRYVALGHEHESTKLIGA